MEITAQENTIAVDEETILKLSPLQRKILLELSAGPLTLSELSEKTGSTVYTIGKQLSLLQFRTKYNPLEKKGILEPLIKKRKEPGVKTTYFLRALEPKAPII